MDSNKLQMLEKSPMFQLSLGSKELFHSNFLYWLWKAEPDAFWKIMSRFDIKQEDGMEVFREKNNLDLSIYNKDGYVVAVIENKVKSVPDKAQLEKYDSKIADINKRRRGDIQHSIECKKILLSLMEADISNSDWEKKTYDDYLKILEDIELTASYAAVVFIDYCSLISSLLEFKKEWVGDEREVMDMKYLDIQKQSSEAIRLRINDLRQKMLFSKMFSELKECLDEKYKPETGIGTTKEIFDKGHTLTIGYGMTRATGLIEAKVKINKDYLLGIQVQGNQYRHFIEFSSSVKNVKVFERRELPEMFSQNHKEEFDIRNNNKEICSYKNKEGKKTFQYVYRLIKEDETVDDVVKNIVEDVEFLMNRINK